MKRLMTILMAATVFVAFGVGTASAAGGKNRGTIGQGATSTKRLKTGTDDAAKTQVQKKAQTQKQARLRKQSASNR